MTLLALGFASGSLIQTDYTDPWQLGNYLLSLRPAALLAGGLCLAIALLLWEIGPRAEVVRVALAVAILIGGAAPLLRQLATESQPTINSWRWQYLAWQTQRATARAVQEWRARDAAVRAQPVQVVPRPTPKPPPQYPVRTIPEPSSLEACAARVTGACPPDESCDAAGDHRCHRYCISWHPCVTSEVCRSVPTGEMRDGKPYTLLPLCFDGRPGPAELANDRDFAARAQSEWDAWRAANPQRSAVQQR